jgi:hypothetical protein
MASSSRLTDIPTLMVYEDLLAPSAYFRHLPRLFMYSSITIGVEEYVDTARERVTLSEVILMRKL